MGMQYPELTDQHIEFIGQQAVIFLALQPTRVRLMLP